MSSIKPFQATDLFNFTPINLDPLTENFYLYFYHQYLYTWPTLSYKSVNENQEPTGYMLAKTEGQGKEWHAHISAVTVDPNYRRVSLGSYLCEQLKIVVEPERPINAWFIDLFVKCSNKTAITMYEKLGYSVFRRVIGYYETGATPPTDIKKVNDDIDAYDMRISLKRDTKNETVRDNGRKMHVLPEEVVF
ncbi:peptide alpha-N-acetyltransferase complex B subunit [Pichia kluyveri]|uniref:Peptide alpha-N-acetyltransferase complex B subunit n=1 Tax=Pichia kluyveri TaxID=36015 RepID=A0AAV5R3U2_PICKL|nr:peptide alpha-N-acetyltransferase complex B subunit [Pichia kluyveri]